MWGLIVESDSEREDPVEEAPEPDFVRTGLLFYGAMAVAAVVWRTGIYG